MSLFAEHAQQLLDAAAAAAQDGVECSETTILIDAGGAIRVCVDSDWPLDALALDRGARAAYRITTRSGMVRVEGREGLKRCVLESAAPGRAARMALAARC